MLKQNLLQSTAAEALTALLTELRRVDSGYWSRFVLRWAGLILLLLLIVVDIIAFIRRPLLGERYVRIDIGGLVMIAGLSFLWLRLWRWRPRSGRYKTILEAVPSCLWGAQRADVPLILEVAGELLPLGEGVAEQGAKLALTKALTQLLPLVPVDELLALTPRQRKALSQVTAEAIEASRVYIGQETLAVTGLLALGSLKDPSLVALATRTVSRHTRGHVCAAAEEYLAALRSGRKPEGSSRT